MPIAHGELLALARQVDIQHRMGMDRFAAGGADTPTTNLVADTALAAFAASIELALVDAYAIVNRKLAGTAAAPLTRLFASHHLAHANAFNQLAGATPVSAANPNLIRSLGPQLGATPDELALLALIYATENRAAATYQYALENLTVPATITLTASIMPVECQHAVVLGTLLGKAAKETVPGSYQTKDGYLDPAQYPIA